MFTVHKISLNYDHDQDRIAVTAETIDGQALALWLTQRLAVRMCKALGNWLDDDVRARAAVLDAPSLHSWAQTEASSQHAPSIPANPGSAPLVALINAVSIGRIKGDCLLALRWGTEEGCKMAMTPTELRQWLDILYRQFLAGDWPTQQLPAWLAKAEEVGPGSSRALH